MIKVTNENIQGVFQKFYSELYSSPNASPSRIQNYLTTNFPGKQFSEAHAAALDAHVSPKEVMDVISSLNNNKAPGEGGFLAEFCKRYAPSLSDPLAKKIFSLLDRSHHHGTQPS